MFIDLAGKLEGTTNTFLYVKQTCRYSSLITGFVHELFRQKPDINIEIVKKLCLDLILSSHTHIITYTHSFPPSLPDDRLDFRTCPKYCFSLEDSHVLSARSLLIVPSLQPTRSAAHGQFAPHIRTRACTWFDVDLLVKVFHLN